MLRMSRSAREWRRSLCREPCRQAHQDQIHGKGNNSDIDVLDRGRKPRKQGLHSHACQPDDHDRGNAASRNGKPRTRGVGRLTKNGPMIRPMNGRAASHRMLRTYEPPGAMYCPPDAKLAQESKVSPVRQKAAGGLA